jgi:hypothetical protein
MANTNAPFGFQDDGVVGGGTPGFILQDMLISSANATPIFTGDAVVPVTGSVTGYIKQATASTVPLAGIFWGCSYLSISAQKRVWRKMWPGADALGDVVAQVITDPLATFTVQAGGSAIGLSSLGLNVQLNVGTGNTTTGISGMYIESPANTSTLPFRIVGFIQAPGGAPGTDITSAYNWVRVKFNNEWLTTPSQSIG